MTNAEWMIQKGYKFDGLRITRKDIDTGYEYATLPPHHVQEFTIICHVNYRLEKMFSGTTYNTVPDHRIIDMWLDAPHIPEESEDE